MGPMGWGVKQLSDGQLLGYREGKKAGDGCLVACRVPTLRILLTNTKVPRSTKVLVAGVKEKILKVQCPRGCRVGCVW